MIRSPEQIAESEYRYDIERRIYDDSTTWLAEVLDGPMLTTFEYMYDGGELYSQDGSPLRPIFETAITDARKIAAANPNLAFELRRRLIEYEEYEVMLEMAESGPNTMVVVSDFPPELQDSTTDIGGYNVSRKQTMLRVITRMSDGSIRMQSRSLDRSDRSSLEAIYRYLGHEDVAAGELLGQRVMIDLQESEQELLVEDLTRVYDRSMAEKYGGHWYAGGVPAEVVNTYDFVKMQSDLIAEFVWQQMVAPEYAESLRYGIAAAIENRYKQRFEVNVVDGIYTAIAKPSLYDEIHRAANYAMMNGRTFSGCGMSLRADEQGTARAEMTELGFGNKSDEESSYKFDKRMHCVVCQAKPKQNEPKKMCGPCGICKGCDTKIRRSSLN